MSRKRDRLEIIYEILRIVRDHHNSIKPTPLLRRSNLSSQSFSEYYQELLDKQLVREVLDKNNQKFISLTDRGFRYINKYQYIQGFIEEFEL